MNGIWNGLVYHIVYAIAFISVHNEIIIRTKQKCVEYSKQIHSLSETRGGEIELILMLSTIFIYGISVCALNLPNFKRLINKTVY